MESFFEAWDLICENCRKHVTDVSYETFFSKLKPISLDFEEGVAIIEAPNEFHKATIERGFANYLKDAVQSVLGPGITYKLVTPIEKKERKEVEENDEYEYTFETFIEGSSNKFACAACRYVAKEPAKNYNPLFIYGNSGLGKTHLLNAVGHELKKNFPEKTIIYVKGDQFANELIESIRAGTTAGFREKYRKADALLIDDIQFIAGKESTQEEFFHTFNTLYESKKQIVLTSDRPPRDIATLEDRLKTRFEWGLTADVQPPDFETRMAIIKRKAELVGLTVPDNVCEFIAVKLKSNIRGHRQEAQGDPPLRGRDPDDQHRAARDQRHRQQRPADAGHGRQDHRGGRPHVRRLPRGHQVLEAQREHLVRPPDLDVRRARNHADADGRDRQGVRRPRPLDGRVRDPADRRENQKGPRHQGHGQRHHQEHPRPLSPGGGRSAETGFPRNPKQIFNISHRVFNRLVE